MSLMKCTPPSQAILCSLCCCEDEELCQRDFFYVYSLYRIHRRTRHRTYSSRQSRRLLHLLLAVVLTYGFFLGLPPFRFATTGGSSTFFGRPPLRLRGAGGSDETTAGSATGAAFPSLWAAILNRTRSPV